MSALQTLAIGVVLGSVISALVCCWLWWAADLSPAQAEVFRRAIMLTACLALLGCTAIICCCARK